MNWSETCWFKKKRRFLRIIILNKFIIKSLKIKTLLYYFLILLHLSPVISDFVRVLFGNMHDSATLLSGSRLNWIIIHKSRHFELLELTEKEVIGWHKISSLQPNNPSTSFTNKSYSFNGNLVFWKAKSKNVKKTIFNYFYLTHVLNLTSFTFLKIRIALHFKNQNNSSNKQIQYLKGKINFSLKWKLTFEKIASFSAQFSPKLK